MAREALRGLRLPLKAKSGGRILAHGHCHQKAFGLMKSIRKTLGMIEGQAFEIIDSGCCGMAGSFGFEAEHYEASQKMAELDLLPAVRAADPQDVIVADGFSCRHQISGGSGRKSVHMAVALRDALVTA